MGFSGFSPETVSFLFELPFQNTMERLPENKEKAQALITWPLTELYQALAPAAQGISPTIETKPAKCISTLFSDMRFSRGTPLKTYLYLRFREPGHEKDALGFFFDMGSQDYGYGLRIYHQTSTGMEKIRESVQKNRAVYISALRKAAAHGFVLTGDSFIKDHFPGESSPELKSLLNRKGFYISRTCPISDRVFSQRLAEEIGDGFSALSDLYLLFKADLYGGDGHATCEI